MNKSVVILLLVCLLMPFAGSYLFLHFKKTKIRKEVAFQLEKGLHEKDLVVLKFTKEESETRINWKHSREFEFDGQMYDIVNQSQEGDSILYTCYKDHKETRLNAKQERIIAKALGQDPFRKKQTDHIKSFFKTVFSQDAFAWKTNIIQLSDFQFSTFILQFSSLNPTPPSPPPKYC